MQQEKSLRTVSSAGSKLSGHFIYRSGGPPPDDGGNRQRSRVRTRSRPGEIYFDLRGSEALCSSDADALSPCGPQQVAPQKMVIWVNRCTCFFVTSDRRGAPQYQWHLVPVPSSLSLESYCNGSWRDSLSWVHLDCRPCAFAWSSPSEKHIVGADVCGQLSMEIRRVVSD